VGPDVLLIGGLGDTVESWQFHAPELGRQVADLIPGARSR
jgi:hypothetical protein